MSNSARDLLIVDAQALLADGDDRRGVVLEVRLADPAAALAGFEAGHIPGAQLTTVVPDFSAAASALSGALPLPALEDVQASLARWGVENGRPVTVYSESPAIAARAWWVLRWAGVEQARLLDGGLAAWKSAGGDVETGPARKQSGTAKPLKASSGHLPQVLYEDLQDQTSGAVLLDARGASGFASENGPTHIPGAKNIPADRAWNEAGRLRSPTELEALFQGVSTQETGQVVSYCGGGVLSAYEVLALKSIGIDAAIYIGSWSEWTKRKALETGVQ